MAGITLTRKRELIAAVAVLVLVVAAVLVLTRNTQASAGPLRHDDTLRTTTVEKTWQVERPRYDACMAIRFKGTVSGNARATWGLAGPTTVWENLRVRGGYVEVTAHQLGSDGECSGRMKMERLVAGQAWKTRDGEWRGYRQTKVTTGKGSYAWNGYSAMALRLDGDAVDRGEAYRTTLGVDVEPHWREGGTDIADGFQVEHTVELPVD